MRFRHRVLNGADGNDGKFRYFVQPEKGGGNRRIRPSLDTGH